MKKHLLLFLSAITIITVYADSTDNSFYHNLYGIQDWVDVLFRKFQKLVSGVLQYLKEGDENLSNELKDIMPTNDKAYDFIVVGAGSAGSVIASRLSEITNVTVLLIEAGGSENFLMDIPVLVNYLQLSDQINWKYQTEPSNTHCQAMKGRKCNWPRGKVMGGSSVLNYMIATRGNPLDYDNWAAMGNEGWSYADLLKYFKKLEAIGIPDLQNDIKLHNTNGPLSITYPPFHTPLAEGFLKASQEMGYPIVDYNSNKQVGFSYIQATLQNGTRTSTNKAYLYPVRNRKNLFVSKYSHVTKVLINSKNKTAYGIEFKKFNKTIHVRVKKEIILSAGAIGSPQILMLSGIGPAKHLQEMEIKVIQDAPVGENLMDHIAYGGLVFLINQPLSLAAKDLINPLNSYLSDFLLKRQGPYTIPGGCEALAFIDVDQPGKLDVFPNIELLFIAGSLVADSSFRYSFGISDEYWRIFKKVNGHSSWTIFPMLMRPKSRGRMLLRSKDPMVKPKLFANYLDDVEDVRIMIKGIRTAIQLSQTKAMQQFNSTLYEISIPGCENYVYDSDQYWECAVRAFTFTIYHYSGTCTMAPEDDPTSVVNSKLQVNGVKRLRVADASIMPQIMTGHPNVPVIMIGEKLADMIKEDWGYKIDNYPLNN